MKRKSFFKSLIGLACLFPLCSLAQDTTVTTVANHKSLVITIKNGNFHQYDTVKINGHKTMLVALDSVILSGVTYKKFWPFGVETAPYVIQVGDTVSFWSKTVKP